MKHLKKLSNLVLLTLLFVSANLYAETKWEVAVVFLEKGSDVEENIIEIQSIEKNSFLSVKIFNKSLSELPQFLDRAFLNKNSKKSLIIYSHGKGPRGLNSLSTTDLKELISSHTPHLDLLWFDSCFMANIEFLYELRDLSSFTIASEDAEFSSGMPFQSLEFLPQVNNSEDAAQMLAQSFIESYSYIKNGTQRNYVSETSATISIFDNSKWNLVVDNLKVIAEKMKQIPLNLKLLKKNYSMEGSELIDLGRLLVFMRTVNRDKELDIVLTNTIRLLNIHSVKNLKTNPRLKIHNPDKNSIMVYGFNNWSWGTQNDFTQTPLLNQILTPHDFILGPASSEWPYRVVKTKTISLTPFAPGINEFNYYFLNSTATKLLSKSLTAYRTSDVVEVYRENQDSPLLYTAYTQEIGRGAEKYTGLSITLPNTIPSLDYFELEFNSSVQWLSL